MRTRGPRLGLARAAPAALALGPRLAHLEQHRDEPGLDAGALVGLVEPGGAPLLDAGGLLTEALDRLRQLAPALRVERHRLAAEVRVVAVESAGHSRGAGLVDCL